MNCLLIRPYASLAVARSFHAFFRLEPLDLEIVAGGVPPPHRVRILDLTVHRNPMRVLERELAAHPPDLIGFGGYSNQAPVMKELARLVRRACPSATIIVGGVHATIAPVDLALPGVVDVVVRGEGGIVIPEILRTLEQGSLPPSSARLLRVGDPDFATWAASDPPEWPCYADVPSPRRDLLKTSDYTCMWPAGRNARVETLFPEVATVRTSTGCPYRCNFCVVHFLASGKYLQRSPEEVVDELAALPQRRVYFVDDEMFINAARTRRIADLLIERGVQKEYISWARSDTICRHPDLFRRWKEAGLRLLYVGLESMDPELLRKYNKGVTADTNRQAVEVLREIGVGLHAALMVDPGFDKNDFLALRRTLDFLLPSEVSFTVYSPSPGTKAWNENRDRFITPDPYAFYDCMHTLLPTKLPLNEFYRYFSLLYLFAIRGNPWRANRVRPPLRDVLQLLWRGMRCGYALRHIYRDYPRALW